MYARFLVALVVAVFSLIKYANFYVSFEGLPETEQRFVTIVYLIV